MFEDYDTLSKVYCLYATLSKNENLKEFSFVTTWPKLKIEEKKKKKMIELKCAVDAIRAKKLTLKDLVVSQLKTMCKWKKQPGDATLPTTKKALKQFKQSP